MDSRTQPDDFESMTIEELRARPRELQAAVARFLRRFGREPGRCTQLFDACAARIVSAPDNEMNFAFAEKLERDLGADVLGLVEVQLEGHSEDVAFACGAEGCPGSHAEAPDPSLIDALYGAVVYRAFGLDVLVSDNPGAFGVPSPSEPLMAVLVADSGRTWPFLQS